MDFDLFRGINTIEFAHFFHSSTTRKMDTTQENNQTPDAGMKPMVFTQGKQGLKARRGALIAPLVFDEDSQMMPPPPTTTSDAKRRKRGPFVFDRDILHAAFSPQALADVIVQSNTIRRVGKDMAEYTFQYLKKNFILKLNAAGPVSCFTTSNGALALFDVRHEDYDAINNLHKFLLCRLNLDPAKTIVKSLDPNETLFLRDDAMTTFWNRDGKRISQLPACCIECNVAVKIMGVQLCKKTSEVQDGSSQSDIYEVKPLVHLEQVRVLSNRTEEAFCMFTN